MLVHIFGAKSSISVAGYALRRTAKDNVHDHSEAAADAVLREFYVDDLLKLFPNEEEAKSVSKELQCLLAKGGFQLTKRNSNSREVLEEFPVEDRAPVVKNLDLESEMLPMDRALGVDWDVGRDTINLVVSDKKEPNNGKGVLSSIATVYDLLGLSSPLILPAREINQELCRLKFDWSRELPKELSDRWTKWKEELRSLDKYEIPRCFKTKDFGPIQQVELHQFADALQEHGYGTVSYLGLINERRDPVQFRDGEISSKTSEQGNHRSEIGSNGSNLGNANQQDCCKRIARKTEHRSGYVLDRFYDSSEVYRE